MSGLGQEGRWKVEGGREVGRLGQAEQAGAWHQGDRGGGASPFMDGARVAGNVDSGGWERRQQAQKRVTDALGLTL